MLVCLLLAVTELQGSVTELTLDMINVNMTTSNNSISSVMNLATDLREMIVTGLEPDSVYSAVLTVTVHGGYNITSDPALVHTTSGGYSTVPYTDNLVFGAATV